MNAKKKGAEQEKQTEEVVEVGFVQGNNTHMSRYVGNTQHACTVHEIVAALVTGRALAQQRRRWRR